MSFTTVTTVVETNNPMSSGTSPYQNRETIAVIGGTEKKVSNWTRLRDWISNHKREIGIALLVIGIATAITGVGLAIGAGLAGSVSSSVFIFTSSAVKVVTTTSPLYGKLVITGAAITGTGGVMIGTGTGLLIGANRQNTPVNR